MRRASDTRERERTGTGRRGRDLLACGEPPDNLRRGGELENLSWFAADDLRSAALSMTNLESYLVTVHRALHGRAAGVDGLADANIDGDLDRLERSLASLRRTLRRIGRV